MLYSAIDYMLENTSLVVYLLLITHYLRYNLDVSGKFNLLFNNLNIYILNFKRSVSSAIGKNDKLTLSKDRGVQSAENLLEFSETIRQLPSFSNFNEKEQTFYNWFAGVIDGDGNFDIRKNKTNSYTLKAIRIKLHNRDLRILTYIQDKVHIGRIVSCGNKPHSIYIVSTKSEIFYLINKLNGLIRIKVDSFKRACNIINIEYTEADYIIKKNDPYLSGLIDTDGSIIFNYTNNRIECVLELIKTEYSSKLCLDNVISQVKPSVYYRTHKSPNNKNKLFESICFKYQTVESIVPVYDYFIINRLYCDFKFYRVSIIKKFIEIRLYKNYPFESIEYKLYSKVIFDWIKYRNPNWTKVPFVSKLNIDR